jgi:heme-degrading monooxygenase HmoA
MYVKVTQGRIRQGAWKEFEAAYKRVVDGPIPGLRTRYLVWDMDDRDCGHSITVWESLEALRAYEASDLFKKVIEPALQPFFVNEFKTYVSEIAMQKSDG